MSLGILDFGSMGRRYDPFKMRGGILAALSIFVQNLSLWYNTVGTFQTFKLGTVPCMAIMEYVWNGTKASGVAALKTTQVPATLGGLKITLKVKVRQNEAVSSKLSHVDPLTNLLWLTSSNFFFDFGSMGWRYGKLKKQRGGGSQNLPPTEQ